MSTPAQRAAERYYQYVCEMPDDVSDAEAIARGAAIIDDEFDRERNRGTYYSCNGSVLGCERERFGMCAYHDQLHSGGSA